MSTVALLPEEQTIYDHIVELEKLGGSAAYLNAIQSAPKLLRHDLQVSVTPMGLDLSVALKRFKVTSSWGTMNWEAETVDGHKGSGKGLGYISTDIDVEVGDLFYITWGMLLGGISWTVAGADGYLFIYFSSNSIPAGFLKAKADFGAAAGSGSGSWTTS